MNDNQGPSIRNIPAHSERVCDGCIFLDKTPMMRGHKSVTDNYACKHPDFANNHIYTSLISGKSGRSIHYNHEGPCTTPSWCPFLNKPKR